LIATHLQQFGGWSDGVCPAGQAAQRTFEQSVTVVSTGTHLQQSGGLSGGKILGANSETCLEIRDRGIMWMHDADSRRGQELALWSVLAAANYNYIIEWRFRDDGVISSRIGATGAPAGGDTHVHGPLWRLDIDLNGACCDTVTHMSHKEMGLTGVDSMADLNNATGLKWDPVAYDTLHIRDAVLKNGNGKPSMWMFMPERSGTPVHQEPFTQMVFWVTPYVWNQTDGAQLPSYVANRPNTANTDTVVWYYGGLHHVIRDEDNAPDGWSQMTLTMYEGVHLMPFNLWSSTPFYP
jgi:primary-amine oxidase